MVEWKSIEPGQWKPENVGDTIEGVLINVIHKTPDLSARYYIENPVGKFLVWGSTVLDDRMAAVKVGSIVRITFKGKVKNKKRQDVKIFGVEVAVEPKISEESVYA